MACGGACPAPVIISFFGRSLPRESVQATCARASTFSLFSSDRIRDQATARAPPPSFLQPQPRLDRAMLGATEDGDEDSPTSIRSYHLHVRRSRSVCSPSPPSPKICIENESAYSSSSHLGLFSIFGFNPAETRARSFAPWPDHIGGIGGSGWDLEGGHRTGP